MIRMRDADVRYALHRKILAGHRRDPNTLVLDELCLARGDARVDIAVVNGKLHGYEIKSDADTLQRLPAQAEIYNSTLDLVTIVAGAKHVAKVEAMVPEWWCVKIVSSGPRGGVGFRDIRRGRMNPCIDPIAVAHLLWREEAVELLEMYGCRGVRSKNRSELAVRLGEEIPLPALRDAVRNSLKSRVNWRSVSP